MNEIEPGVPYLEYHPKTGGPIKRTAIAPLPFTIGRSDGVNMRIDSTQVSREHARITRRQGELRITDLGSTNGTFVNGQRIEESRLEHGDIVHVATAELIYFSGQTVKSKPVATQVLDPHEARAAQLGSPACVVRAVRRLQEMLVHRIVRTCFQPVVDFKTEGVLGYAASCGGDHELSRSPADQFLLSVESRVTDRLSHVARLAAAEEARRLPDGARVFLALHPSEVGHESLLESLCALETTLTSDHTLVVEIPEAAVSDGAFMGPLLDRLSEHGIAVAYAGFSAGKSRLAELAEAPPEFLKLDKSLVHGLPHSEPRKRQLREIVASCEEHGIKAVAVGVETEDEARECCAAGCHAAQGAWFAAPQSLSSLLAENLDLAQAPS
ncbi:MAG TPA: EAL domain-containing protein [Pirellulales bacterium]|nr:EAL domain-containing protein [Pirellulales bacterium]